MHAPLDSGGRQRQTAASFVFFDDLEQNLVYPKQLQWTTVWITGAQQRPRRRLPHVNYMFRTVHEALTFFLARENATHLK